MKNKMIPVLSIIALIVVSISSVVYFNNNMAGMNENSKDVKGTVVKSSINTHDYSKNIVTPNPGQPIKKFTLVTTEKNMQLSRTVVLPVWTYNGTVPGQEIRVTQGDFVQVKLMNSLSDPVTIHWHGYPLNSAMDGIPGLTQDAVKQGETFTYEFSADVTGTYWYHSHQEGSKQVDKGLYGALIVEPKVKEKIDKDFTLILDEWMDNPDDMGDMMGSKEKEVPNTPEEALKLSKAEEIEMSTAYNIFTVNGKSGDLIETLEVNKGDIVRLRFINAGYRSHGIHVPGQDIKVISTDGQNISEAGLIKDQIVTVGPGERYDIEFTVSGEENFVIDAHDNNKYNNQIKIPVNIVGGSGKNSIETTTKLTDFDLASYGKPGTSIYTLDEKYDVVYDAGLDAKMKDGALKYTINGQSFDESTPLKMKKDDLIKITYSNKSTVDHPMHLHGHFFQVLSKNGKAITGSAISKDTILVKPGESYIIAFKADNPGLWVQHCHELHHAAAGMMQKIEYTDYKPNYIPSPSDKFNKPE